MIIEFRYITQGLMIIEIEMKPEVKFNDISMTKNWIV